MSARTPASPMPFHRLRPGHPVLLCGAGGPLSGGVAASFAEAGARVVAAFPDEPGGDGAGRPGVLAVPLGRGADGLARAYGEAERVLGRPRTVVSLPDLDVTDPTVAPGAVLALDGAVWSALAETPVGRTAGLARLAAARGAKALVVVVGTPAPGAQAVAEAGRLAVARALAEELAGSAVRVHVVVVGAAEPAFRPAVPGGALMLDVAAGLSPADVGGLCVLLASDAGAALASETVRLEGRADLLRWLGGR